MVYDTLKFLANHTKKSKIAIEFCQMDHQKLVRDIESVDTYTSKLYYDPLITTRISIPPTLGTNSQFNLTRNDLLEASKMLGNKAVGIDGLKDTHLKEIM